MKKDNLDRFITEHKEEFDTDVPNLKIWRNIEGSLSAASPKKAKRILLRPYLKIAVSVVILLTIGAVFGFYIANSGQQQAVALADISPEYAEMEHYYQRQVAEKTKILATYNQNQYFQEDIQQLDQLLEELRKELSNAPKGAKEQLISAMINNYRAKIDILEHVLEHIELNSKTNKKNEVINL